MEFSCSILAQQKIKDHATNTNYKILEILERKISGDLLTCSFVNKMTKCGISVTKHTDMAVFIYAIKTVANP